jgi:prepilin-type N-terminal cleavage/methylation domain-containing protein
VVNRDRRDAGFSLIELVVSVGLMGVVVMYLMQSFTTQQRTYVMVDQVTEAQQNLRTISDLVEREIRLAGFMVDQAGAVCGVDRNNAPDTLFVSDAGAIDPANATQATMGGRLPVGAALVSGTQTLTFTLGDTVVLDGQPAYDTNGDNVNDSDFQPNAGVIIYDRNSPSRGAACGTITRVTLPSTIVVNLAAWTLGGAAAGAQLVAVPAHVYQVNANAQLLRDGLVVAEDVEDLQVAYFFDTNRNGRVDNGENPGSAAGPAYVPSNAVADNTLLRELRVNFVVRTRGTDPTFREGLFQTTENRLPPAATAADPQLRRRIHSTTVRVRNVGNRGLLT